MPQLRMIPDRLLSNPSTRPSLVRAGKAVYIVGICFSYETFGKTRFSSLCMYLDPEQGRPLADWGFAACPVGNDDWTE